MKSGEAAPAGASEETPIPASEVPRAEAPEGSAKTAEKSTAESAEAASAREGGPRTAEMKAIPTGLDSLGFAAREMYNKLAEGTKNFVSGLYERARLTLGDRLDVWANSKLFEWHERKAVGWKSQVEAREQEIQSLQDAIRQQEAYAKDFEAKYGRVPAEAQAKLARDKQKMQDQIERVQRQKDRAESKLEYRNNKKAIYENARRRIGEDVIARMDSRLAPYEGRAAKLEEDQRNFSAMVKAYEEQQAGYREELSKLYQDLESVPYPSMRSAIKMHIDQVEGLLDGARLNADEMRWKMVDAEKRLSSIDRKAAPWRDARDEFARVTQREGVVDTSIEGRDAEEVRTKPADVGFRRRRAGDAKPEEAAPARAKPAETGKERSPEEEKETGEAKGGKKETEASGKPAAKEKLEVKPAKEAKEKSSGARTVTPAQYLKAWASAGGREGAKAALEILKETLKGTEKKSVAEFENLARSVLAGLGGELDERASEYMKKVRTNLEARRRRKKPPAKK